MPSIEQYGYNKFHRKETVLDQQIVDPIQSFPDVGIDHSRIGAVKFSSILAGTVKSKQFMLDVQDGQGDCFFGANKETFDTTGNGFILGIDDSDGNKPKFFMTNGTYYFYFDGDTFGMNVINAVINGSELGLQSAFGYGSSDITYAVNTDLTADVYAHDLTINNGVVLNTNGYRIFANGTLTNNGTIQVTPNNGSNGSNGAAGSGGAGGAGGAALSAGSLPGTEDGKVGTDGADGATGATGPNSSLSGTNGDSVSKSLIGNGMAGAQGGSAGTGTSKAGGNGGTPGTAGTGTTDTVNKPYTIVGSFLMYDPNGTAISRFIGSGGNGGSTGGGGGGNAGALVNDYGGGGGGAGGAGSPGGILQIWAKIIVNNGTIQSNGGNGGDGGNGETAAQPDVGINGGGGGGAGGVGGRGGFIQLIYSSYTNNDTVQVSGGNGGNGGSGGLGTANTGAHPGGVYDGNAGANGDNGDAGIILTLKI